MTTDEANLIAQAALCAIALAIYFIPAFVGRNKRNASAIFWLNLLMGWTLLGWVGALIWALTIDRDERH